MAYQSVALENVVDVKQDDLEAHRKHLFDAYVQQMFQRMVRTKNIHYGPGQTKHWLTWLAQRMIKRGQTVFYLEHLHQMPEPHIQNVFHLLFFAFVFAGIVIVISGMSPEFMFLAGWISLAFPFLSSMLGVAFGIFVISRGHKGNNTNAYNIGEKLIWTWKKRRKIFGISFLLLPVLVLIAFLWGGKPSLLFADPFIVSFFVLAFGLHLEQENETSRKQHETHDGSFVVSNNRLHRLIKRLFDNLKIVVKKQSQLGSLVERLRWSWRRSWKGFFIGFVIGTVFVLLYYLFVLLIMVALLKDLPDFNIINDIENYTQYINPLIPIVFWGVIFGVLGFILYGLSSVELETKSYPNQGIKGTLRSVLLVIFLFIGTFGTATAIVSPFFIDMKSILGYSLFSFLFLFVIGGLTVGLFFGLIFGIYYGGYALLHHFVIRYVLFDGGYIPWNYVHFLNYCVDRIFLRRVGGGYIFVHRLLMEHFADMYTADEK